MKKLVDMDIKEYYPHNQKQDHGVCRNFIYFNIFMDMYKFINNCNYLFINLILYYQDDL